MIDEKPNFVTVKNKRILEIANSINSVMQLSENVWNENGNPCADVISARLGYEVAQREVDYCCGLWEDGNGNKQEHKNAPLFDTLYQCRLFYPSWD